MSDIDDSRPILTEWRRRQVEAHADMKELGHSYIIAKQLPENKGYSFKSVENDESVFNLPALGVYNLDSGITFLLFQLCSSRLCGSIARVNTRNGANARALERLLVVPSVLPTSPTCRVECTLPDNLF